MTNMLQAGAEWLSDVTKEHAGNPVSYAQGATVVPVAAVPARTSRTENDVGDVIHVDVERRDFLIKVDDLQSGGTPIVPAAGDTITWVRGASTLTFEVLADGEEPPARESDPFGVWWRVHTKLKGQA